MLLNEIEPGLRLAGVRADGPVEVVAFDRNGDRMGTLVYRARDGGLGQRLVSAEDALQFSAASDRRWTFDADGDLFRLASEARRIGLAYLFDPFAAVDASGIDPLPHQIEAVYKELLPRQPLAFLLADDPGAGKTIMSGLYIRELMLRGALFRCLVVAPGSLVEQWQEELHDKFNLRFEIFTREMVEASLSANPFMEKDLLIVRLDQLARNEELQAKLEQASRSKEWDLVIVDEAHKMSAHRYGQDLKKTKRFQLGEKLRDQARNLLLLTATPHNGKEEDFLAFMTLLDPDRFAGRHRPNSPPPKHDDLMRRKIKETLLTFDGKKLFPERRANTLAYDLSDPEQRLYEEVTDYVRNGMNRADQLREQNDRRAFVIGFALVGLQRRLASSPEAIYQSLRRRRERVEKRLAEIRNPSPSAPGQRPMAAPRLSLPSQWEGFDPDEFDDEDMERLEEAGLEETAADLADPEELEKEIRQLRDLEQAAYKVRAAGTDSKWNQLADFLDSDDFKGGDPPRKLIVFTEHKDTLHYLTEKIQTRLGRTEAVENIHGGMKREDRRRVQDRFRNDPRVRVLVATDAAGEGVNLQRANLMVNYDLPWNPNRIEQRFGRIHRIGQTEVCNLWNLVALSTREGQVFERLLQKLENQREAFGDEVYDVLGDPQINQSLQKALLEAIRYGAQPEVKAQIELVVDAEIGDRVKELVQQRALAGEVMSAAELDEIRWRMEEAKARKLSPGFVQAFFSEGLERMRGRMTGRERGRFEITRIPARLRSREHQAKGPIHDRYERVTFDKDLVEGEVGKPRAELIAPGHPLLSALMDEVAREHEHLLSAGATLVDESDPGAEPRILIYLDHKITDGRFDSRGHPETASRQFQYVEVDRHGNTSDPSAEPYLNYRALTEEEAALAAERVDHSWADAEVERVAKDWAISNLASPHLRRTAELTKARVDRVRLAVEQRLNSEIRFWDVEAGKYKKKELQGKKPKRSSGYARQRADELAVRRDERLRELEAEAGLVNHPPTVAAAALVIPQGLLDKLNGTQPSLTPGETEETDRRAVAAVLAAERRLGREPQEMEHNNPGFDILSRAPDGFCFYIEVKGHKPTTPEIKVSKVQVQQGQHHPDRFRLAVVEVPEDPNEDPKVFYLLNPFEGYDLHFAQASLPLKVSDLITQAVKPQ